MHFRSFMVVFFASTVLAQFIPENIHNAPETTPPVSIATAPPSPGDDLAHSLASEASARVSSINSVGQSAIASITSQIGSEASQISSKLDSISSDIASKSSSYSARFDPSNTATNNEAAPAQTGAMVIGALFGIGAVVANY
ncbi:hypothetical protein HI914_04916 [Erysiphe necator]|uniref:Putative csep0049 effector protein n=1 Tax=Uncinula necator TaxID=52586 RepID=A0A0B1NZ09_UNCNE|nr:hypothetical protein HI914_04916 [Erysiphe necator]KHJ30260.1 putative csep0049 effector protein [Erysiphe necator]